MGFTRVAFQSHTKCATKACASGRIAAAYNPRGSNYPSDRQRLIMPGNESRPPPSSGRLVVPGGDQQQRSTGTLGNAGLVDQKATQNFRPPAGFMDKSPEDLRNETSASPDEMLNRLRNGIGHWHELAKLLPVLYGGGYDSVSVEEITGVERLLQGVWGAALPVYESLKRSEVFPKHKLPYFNNGGEYLLYELRYLAVNRRAPVAEYIADQDLDAKDCLFLARAVKEQERRRGEREGFTNSPGDCLAYKYYRDALECRKEDEKINYVEKGLQVAKSHTAAQKLRELYEDKSTTAEFASNRAQVTMLRLNPEEVGFRPVCIVGNYHHVTSSDISRAAIARQSGVFGHFMTGSSDGAARWVALPAWHALATADQPVGIDVPDCSALEPLVESSFIRNDDDRAKLSTPGIIVVDKRVSHIDPDSYYLVAGSGGGVSMLVGSMVERMGIKPCAAILFCVRPPARDATPSESDLGALQL